MYTLSDIFIGDFRISQRFGVNKANYTKFGLQGHNAIDFACPEGTQILSTAKGLVIESAFDATGYGNYIKVLHEGFYTVYAHLSQKLVKVGQEVLQGQLLGLSGNTGNSTGPHLHFGVAPCNSAGGRTQTTNGYGGYINPLDRTVCKWELKNLKVPNVPPVEVDPDFDGKKALEVLKKYKYQLILPDGDTFGTLEGMANFLCQDAFPVYVAAKRSNGDGVSN